MPLPDSLSGAPAPWLGWDAGTNTERSVKRRPLPGVRSQARVQARLHESSPVRLSVNVHPIKHERLQADRGEDKCRRRRWGGESSGSVAPPELGAERSHRLDRGWGVRRVVKRKGRGVWEQEWSARPIGGSPLVDRAVHRAERAGLWVALAGPAVFEPGRVPDTFSERSLHCHRAGGQND